MKGIANYLILPEFRLILECCKGEASIEDAIIMKKREVTDDSYDPGFNIIVDFREFETILDSSVNASTTSFFYFLKGLDLNCKIAILTTAPNQVVVSIILRELSNEPGSVRIEVFSTVEAATRYIGIPNENFGLINNKILELNQKTSLHGQ